MAAPKLTPEEKLERKRAGNRAWMSKWREANPEVARARVREAFEKPGARERYNVGKKEYYEANRETFLARSSKAYKLLTSSEGGRAKLQQRNERARPASKRWREANRDIKAVLESNRRARLRNAPGRHTAADVAALFERQRAKCAACKVPVTKTGKAKYHVDHIQPLARGGSNDPANLQLLCKTCNLSKHARDPHEWAREKGLLFL